MAATGGSGGNRNYRDDNNEDRFNDDRFFRPSKTKNKNTKNRNSRKRGRKQYYGDSYQAPKPTTLSQYFNYDGEPQRKRQKGGLNQDRNFVAASQSPPPSDTQQNDDRNSQQHDIENNIISIPETPSPQQPEAQNNDNSDLQQLHQSLGTTPKFATEDSKPSEDNSDDDVLQSDQELGLAALPAPGSTIQPTITRPKSRPRARITQRPKRKHWCLSIPNLKSQLEKMNVNPDLFKNNIKLFSRLLNDLLPRGTGASKRNIDNHILVYEGVRDDDNSSWHAHAYFAFNDEYKVTNRQPGFSIHRKRLHEWLFTEMENEQKNHIADDDELQDNEYWSYKIDNAKDEFIDEDHTHLRIQISDDYVGKYDGFIYYMFKTYSYGVTAMRVAGHCDYSGYEDDVEIQKKIQKIVTQKAAGKNPNTGVMLRMTKPLSTIHDLDEFDKTVQRIRLEHADTLMQYWRNFGNIVKVQKKRIIQELRNKRSADSRALPELKRDWTIDDFQYGTRITTKRAQVRKPLMDWYFKAYQNIVGFIQDNMIKGVNTKNNCLFIKCRRYTQGKSLVIELLKRKFNGYNLKCDKGWNGAHYDEGVQFFYIDSATSEHFSELGVPMHVLEPMAGGLAAVLTIRGKPPAITKGQPLIITTQLPFNELGYLGKEHARNMLRARTTFISASSKKWKEQSLLPLCYHIMKVWNIKEPYGAGTKSKAELGRYNVLGSDNDDETWRDEGHPGDFEKMGDESDENDKEEAIDHVWIQPEHKIINKNLIYYKGIDDDPYWDEDIDIHFDHSEENDDQNQDRNLRHDDNHNHNRNVRDNNQENEDDVDERLVCLYGISCEIGGQQHWEEFLHHDIDQTGINNVSGAGNDAAIRKIANKHIDEAKDNQDYKRDEIDENALVRYIENDDENDDEVEDEVEALGIDDIIHVNDDEVRDTQVHINNESENENDHGNDSEMDDDDDEDEDLQK